jgi:homotetrameric NADPH-dependent glutamate synthase
MSKDVLIIGGGVAGIQAALDLGDRGLKVHMVEKSPSIGGTMALLDKTFPTNDCSICILAPKMIECYQHSNVITHTYSEVIGCTGSEGAFKVKVRKKPRYVNMEKCTGCGDCFEKCPVSLPNTSNMGMDMRKAIYMPFVQAVPKIATIDRLGIAPCSNACPGGLSAQGYVALISEGKFKEALDLIREKVPLPSVLGRICHHPCESSCNRKDVDDPVAICTLKAFVGDYTRDVGEDSSPEIPEKRKEKVAIVGGGPAGLTCAYRLALKGYLVKIFEASNKPGGMLYWGIPEYRLPKAILQADVESLLKIGIEIEYGKTVGRDITLEQLQKDYNAVFLAIGAHRSLKLAIEGEELNGVIHGVDFLRKSTRGEKIELGKKVAVIGGGNAAMDAARTALRMGSDVFVLYRRTRTEMPAIEEEIDSAEEEGVQIQYLVSPMRIIGEEGKVKAVECIRNELGKPDETGRRRPQPIEGSEFVIEVDNVIPAISQAPDLDKLNAGELEITKWNTLKVNPRNLSTNIQGVFAGGDAVSGPASAIEAIAAGNTAVKYIERFLNGESIEPDPEEEEQYIVSLEDVKVRISGEIPHIERVYREKLPSKKRRTTFEEVEKIYTKEEAIREAARCLKCGPCSLCGMCQIVCKAEAIDYNQKEEIIDLDVGAIIIAVGLESYDPSPLTEYGFRRYENVHTNMEYERLICASGPTGGHLECEPDKRHPKRMAFIPCVGSRDTRPEGCLYCSSVCCMLSTKDAMLVREHYDETDSFIFYADLRMFGKGHFEYSERARKDYGVTYIHGRPGEIREVPKTKELDIQYIDEETGELKFIRVDFVVLASAIMPGKDTQTLAEILGIKTDSNGFIKPVGIESDPVDTTRSGILVAGYCEEPKDITESVIQASGAAARAAEIIFHHGEVNK